MPNGSTTLTGTGTAFVANVAAGMMVVANNQIIGEVAAVVSNTQITLAVAYAGTTLSGAGYAIANLGAVRNSLITAVQDLTALIEAAQGGALSGRFGDGTLAEPGMAFAGDIDTGFYRPGANRIAATKVLEAPSFGGAGVQSSATDATARRVLLNAAHGLGTAIPTAVTDLNNAMLNGWYGYGSTAANRPFTQGGAVLVISSTGARAMQIAYEHNTGKVAVRFISDTAPSSGAWQPWVEITTASNIGAQIGALASGAVGTHLILTNNSGATVAQGATVAGSNLSPAQSGTWRALASVANAATTTFVRIS